VVVSASDALTTMRSSSGLMATAMVFSPSISSVGLRVLTVVLEGNPLNLEGRISVKGLWARFAAG
jgi:hypothetical protein